MFETHLALLVAVVALIVAVRPRLHRPEAQNISADYIYAKKLIIIDEQEGKRSKQWGFSIHGDRSVIDFPDDIVFDERWSVSLRCGKGEGGFRVEFFLHSPHEPASRFMSIAFSPVPLEISLYDAQDKLLTKFP